MRLFLISLLSLFLFGHTPKQEKLGKRYIVVLKEDFDPHIFITNYDLPKPKRIWTDALKGFTITVSQEMSIQQIMGLENEHGVDFIEPDKRVKLIEPVKGIGPEYKFHVLKQIVPYGIKMVGTFNCKGTPCARKRAFVIDTGIDLDHPDLRVDRKLGFSAFGGSPDDENGHGTHVAGTIGAKNNGKGVIGVAAGARLIPIKVLNGEGSGSTSGVIAGVNHVAKRGRRGDVANMSLGGGISRALDQAVLKASRKGIFFTLAAGNERRNANSSSPGRVNGKYIYTISAVDINFKFASFSNFGHSVDKAEPGVRILSSIPGGGYDMFSGTSMAAPHAAGILLKNGRFGSKCKKAKGDPDGKPDCIGVLP